MGVSVSADEDSLTMTGTISGLEANVTGGIHIHEGTSCDNADDVGGHWWSDDLEDPWTTTTYTSDASGDAVVSITVTDDELGYDPRDFAGRTVVVHDQNGTRVACGVFVAEVEAEPEPQPEAQPEPQPEPQPESLVVIENVTMTLTTDVPLTDDEQDTVLVTYCDTVANASNIDVTCMIEEVVSRRRRLLSEIYTYLLSAWATTTVQINISEIPETFVDDLREVLLEELPDVNITVEATPEAVVTSPEADTDIDDEDTDDGGLSGTTIAIIVVICFFVGIGIALMMCFSSKGREADYAAPEQATAMTATSTKRPNNSMESHDGLMIEDVH